MREMNRLAGSAQRGESLFDARSTETETVSFELVREVDRLPAQALREEADNLPGRAAVDTSEAAGTVRAWWRLLRVDR